MSDVWKEVRTSYSLACLLNVAGVGVMMEVSSTV
jgi:hypothetical protein